MAVVGDLLVNVAGLPEDMRKAEGKGSSQSGVAWRAHKSEQPPIGKAAATDHTIH